MTPGALRVLKELEADEEIDLVQEGGVAYCGNRQTTSRIINELLGIVAISVTSKDGLVQTFTRYAINDIGRALIRRPALEGELLAVIHARRRRPFQVVNDRIRHMRTPRIYKGAAEA